MTKLSESIHNHYNVNPDGNDWHLKCKRCGVAYSVRKAAVSAGVELSLLNHSYSHKK